MQNSLIIILFFFFFCFKFSTASFFPTGAIEGFTVEQMLRKDLKMISFTNGIRAAVPSTLILSSDLCQSENHIEETFGKFCQKYKAQLLIIIAHQKGQRDILIFNPVNQLDSTTTTDHIVNALCAHEETQITKSYPEFQHMIHLRQGNVSFSRKKLLPIILGAVK